MRMEEEQASLSFFFSGGSNADDTKHERLRRVIIKGLSLELTERQRECINMRYIDGMKATDIAGILGLSRATVHKHIRVGLEKLKRLENYL